MSQIELSVVIPSYLEEENLRVLLPRVLSAARQVTPQCEVLVVDTQTPLDHTEKVSRELGARYVARTGGNNFGDAVRTGIASAQGKYLLFMDADGSHPPECIPELYQYRNEADVVAASRYVSGGFTENSKILVLMSSLLNLTYRIILGLRCKDVSNSFKLYRGDQLRSLELRCSNFDIIEEILFKLHRQYRVVIKEVPFTFRKRMFGDTKRNLVAFMFTYFVTLLRLRFSIYAKPKCPQQADEVLHSEKRSLNGK